MKEDPTYLRQSQVIELLRISSSTFWRLRNRNESTFPTPRSISKGIKIWRKSDVLSWIKNEGKLQ